MTHIIAMLGACALFAAPALACDNDDEDGMDVGLVLSGGGAKASTQVGVLQIMDELGIPVHCIAGTSMGAVVGSFYANGYSANEIADILTDNDWGALFRGDIPRRDKSFVEKEREETYFSGNVASFSKDGLQLPGGLSSMQGLKTHYRRILADVPTEMDFNDLAIPFRAVATNLHMGQKTVFRDGDLVEAILASMAVPGVFPPREIDGQLYVDGGLASNLPIQTVQEMGADIIIAIDVSNAPQKPNPRISVASTANQITTIMVWQKVLQELEYLGPHDLLIRPNEEANIATAEYQLTQNGLTAGKVVGKANKDNLLAIKAKAAPPLNRPLDYKLAQPPETFRLVNRTRVKDSIILNRFDPAQKRGGDTRDEDRRLRDLASFGGFGEIDMGRSQGETVLTVENNPLGRNLVQIGLNATSDFEGISTYSFLGRLTRKPLGPRGGDISLSAEFGTNIGLSAELYQPFGAKGRFFVLPEIFATWDERNVNLFGTRIADVWERNLGARGRIGRELGTWGVIALESEIRNARFSELIAVAEGFDTFDANLASAGIYFAVDTLDRNDWPTAGQRARLSARRSVELDDSDASDADLIEASWLGAFDIVGMHTLFNVRYGTNPGNRDGAIENFRLGGFRQIGSFANNSIISDEFSYVSVEVFDRLTGRGRLFDLPIYAGLIGELASVPLQTEDGLIELDLLSGSLYLGIDTPLGPAFLGAAYGNNAAASLFFKFGRTF